MITVPHSTSVHSLKFYTNDCHITVENTTLIPLLTDVLILLAVKYQPQHHNQLNWGSNTDSLWMYPCQYITPVCYNDIKIQIHLIYIYI